VRGETYDEQATLVVDISLLVVDILLFAVDVLLFAVDVLLLVVDVLLQRSLVRTLDVLGMEGSMYKPDTP